MSQPLHEVRVGTIKASVWRRSAASPCSVGITRLYRDGRQWKESSRFAHEDLPAIRLALDLAYEWLFELAQAEAPAATGAAQAAVTLAPAQSSDCDHTHHALDGDGRPTGSWTIDPAGGKPRVVCRVCGKFYGFLPPSKRDQAMQRAYQLQQQRLSCPGCGETPFLG
ncbi:hypothetical protein [Botrimarina sp.]|uniref:hypothetical protein n=1 Tax=Botrimarina sp. TaxID=2795802 RepID=UPI0032EFAA46